MMVAFSPKSSSWMFGTGFFFMYRVSLLIQPPLLISCTMHVGSTGTGSAMGDHRGSPSSTLGPRKSELRRG
ncbi:hypothetical protein EV361DRAFT_367074 [Lentinula raphanica]|nr:hypothetical protein EV361DRAFT_367074 [Lentinula raphanica]